MKGPHGHFTPSVGGVVWSPGCRGSCTGDGQPEDPRAPGTQGQVHAQHLQEPENRHKAAFPGDSLLAKIPSQALQTRGVCRLCVFPVRVSLHMARREGCCVSGCVFVPATPFPGIHLGACVLCVSIWILLWVPLLLWSVCLADATVCGSKPSLQVGAQSSLLTWDTGDMGPHTLEIRNQGGGGRGPREGGVGGGCWGGRDPEVGVGRGEDRGSFTLTSFSNTQLPRKKQDPPRGEYRTPAGCSQHKDRLLADSMN